MGEGFFRNETKTQSHKLDSNENRQKGDRVKRFKARKDKKESQREEEGGTKRLLERRNG